ncbi:hypothetical protein MaMV-DH010016 [Cyanophage MaMV-DH01]|nr:hypothetical protein MaMV-DH010016 [Cyanophage MaMV-DH01]
MENTATALTTDCLSHKAILHRRYVDKVTGMVVERVIINMVYLHLSSTSEETIAVGLPPPVSVGDNLMEANDESLSIRNVKIKESD